MIKKFYTFLFAGILSMLSLSAAIDNSYDTEYLNNSEKIYVEPGMIYVSPNGLFLNVDGELMGITSIQVDENGIFIPSPEAKNCRYHGWYPDNSPVCPQCFADRTKKKKDEKKR